MDLWEGSEPYGLNYPEWKKKDYFVNHNTTICQYGRIVSTNSYGWKVPTEANLRSLFDRLSKQRRERQKAKRTLF